MSHGPANGGWAARRAVARWAVRLLRRDWRKHVLIAVLLAVAVAAAVGFSCAAYNVAPVSGRAEFGDANAAFRFDDRDAAHNAIRLAAGRDWFGAVEAIGHRDVPVPGAVETVDYRVQTPGGVFGAPMLQLRSGRYPTSDAEVAITRWVTDNVGTRMGDTLALDGVDRTVVGVVENPNALHDAFVLLAPSALDSSDRIDMLVRADDARIDGFRPPGDDHRIVSSRGDLPENLLATLVMLVSGTLLLFLVALVATASFAVIAQRRLTQLGMLAAIGATEKHLRTTMLVTGAVTGLVASAVGVVVGMAGWIVAAPLMEGPVGARIEPFRVPWWLAVVGVGLAVVAATLAAWWPGRAMARVPTVAALSGRPPRSTPARRSGFVAAALVIAGAVGLRIGSARHDRPASTLELALLCVGIVALLLGMLLVSPLAIRVLAHAGGRAPIGTRLALRDLGRHHGRSGAALAAISLVLGVPVAIAATAAAAENNQGLGNLATTQLLLQGDTFDGGPFAPAADAVAGLRRGVDAITAGVPGTTAIEFDAAFDPNAPAPRDAARAREVVTLGRPVSNGWSQESTLYVATDAVAGLYAGGDRLTSGTDIRTRATGELHILGAAGSDLRHPDAAETVATTGTLPESYTALPAALIGDEALVPRGWVAIPSGRWLLVSPTPWSNAQVRTVRELAARYGFTVERRNDHARLTGLRIGGVAAGMLLALTVLAMTIGLIRSEAAADLRTLTATGASSLTRRTITAATAGVLTSVGAVIGTLGAYLGLALGRLSALTPLPFVDLAVVVVGTPLVAAAAAWLLAGGEPPALARRPIT